jgi:hypothetical protein
MKSYRVILKGGGVLVIKAAEQTMGEGDRVLYFWENDKVVAGFNMNEISSRTAMVT